MEFDFRPTDDDWPQVENLCYNPHKYFDLGDGYEIVPLKSNSRIVSYKFNTPKNNFIINWDSQREILNVSVISNLPSQEDTSYDDKQDVYFAAQELVNKLEDFYNSQY